MKIRGITRLTPPPRNMELQQNKVYPTAHKALRITSIFCWQTILGGGQTRNSRGISDSRIQGGVKRFNPNIRGMVILIFWMSLGVTYAQKGVYTSSEDIQEVSAPESVAATRFIYRVGEKPDSLRFYNMTMSNMLYGSQKTFVWPADSKESERYRLIFYPTRKAATIQKSASEIIFNDRLILSSSDSLYYIRDTTIKALSPMPRPGIFLMTGMEGATYHKFDNKGQIVPRELPAFFYTINDSSRVCFVKVPRRISMELDPYTSMGQFRTMEVTLPPYPEFRPKFRVLMDLPASAVIDSAGLHRVDNLIQVLHSWYSEDSSSIAKFTGDIKKLLELGLSRRKYEAEETYQLRRAPYLKEMQDVLAQIIAENHMEQLLLPMQQRLQLFKEYRSRQALNLQNEYIQKNKDFRALLLNHHLWKRVFVSGSWIVGHSRDGTAVDQHPEELAGGSVRLEWMQKLYHRISWLALFDGSYSDELSGTAGLGVGIPIGIAPAGNYTLDSTSGLIMQIQAGPVLAYRTTDWTTLTSADSPHTLAYGGLGGLAFYFTRMPILLSMDYSYYSDKQRILALRVGLPIFRWKI